MRSMQVSLRIHITEECLTELPALDVAVSVANCDAIRTKHGNQPNFELVTQLMYQRVLA